MKSAVKPLPAKQPLLILAVAAVLPGVGQVLNRAPIRGLMFALYILLLGAITYHLAAPGASFLGRYAGGLFVYAISVLDAYRGAAYRWAARTSG